MACLLAATSAIAAMPNDDTTAPQQMQQAAVAERQLLIMLRMPAPHYRPDVSYGGSYKNDITKTARRRLAEELAGKYGLKVIDHWPMPALNINCYVMQAGEHISLEQAIRQLNQDPQIEWAQPLNTFSAQSTTQPALSPADAGLQGMQLIQKYWQLNDVHKLATGRNVLVAVVDSGIDTSHPDLQGQVPVRENFVDGNPYLPEAHGTGVAGIIAAHPDSKGITGVAPGARLMALRACWQEKNGSTSCNSFTLGKAINYAILNHAQVINLSLSGPDDPLLHKLIDLANARGIKVTGAVDSKKSDGGFPASHPAVFAVSNQPESGMPDKKILIAPGIDIPTTALHSRWNFVSGASYSTAHISGMMALLSELQPAIKPVKIRDGIIMRNRQDDDVRLSGNIDFCASMKQLSGRCACVCKKD